MKTVKTCALFPLLALAGLGLLPVCAPQARADDTSTVTSFPDVKENHWAYQYVMDLANKGIVKGYPDGRFLGDRSMTRFEFATIIDRMLQTLADMKQEPQPAQPQVTADDLNKIQVLVDTFKDQLAAIQTNVTQAQTDITTLRQQLLDLQQDVQDTKDLTAKAQATANNSYGAGSNRKFQISGYIQARYYNVESSNNTEFPNGKAAANGPPTGNLAKGGAGSTFNVRRARLKVSGQITQNTKFAFQIDDGGSSNAVTAKEANLTYTFNDGRSNNPDVIAGLFATPFGYELPASTGNIYSPERHLAFSENSLVAGPFNNQDYDRGVQLQVPDGNLKFCAALINGTGLTNGTSNNRTADAIYHVAWAATKQIAAGVSYYNGRETTTVAGTPNIGRKRIWGVDSQWMSPKGPFLQGEYMGGVFEQRSYFATPTALTLTTSTAPGNQTSGWYVQGGYVFSPTGAHPLTLVLSYDELDRSTSGVNKAFAGGAPGGTFDDKNWGYGVLYNLDAATRLRLWYDLPTAVAHAAGTASPDKVGLITSEVQVKF